MIFHVQMDVRIPHDMAADAVNSLKATERKRAQDLQRSGKWVHLWRVAGRYSNISILDVSDIDELHEIISTRPLFPFINISVMPLARHPSAID